MKHLSFAPFITAALCAAVALTGPALRAQANFDIHITTSALIGNPAGPFYLDFQLNDGSGLGNNDNTAILSAFNFHGGAALPSVSTFGGAMGNLSSTITLKDSSPFNEIFEAFTPGASFDFHLLLTTKVDSPTPDLFAFSILDSSTFSLPTTAASDAFVEITINGINPTAVAYAGDVAGGGIPIAAPSIVAVPVPSTYGVMAALTLSAATLWRRRTLRAKSA